MMDSKIVLIKRVAQLISLAEQTISHAGTDSFELSKNRLRAQSLHFIKYLYGDADPNFKEFDRVSGQNSANSVANCKAILEGIKHDIDNDYYLSSVRGLVSADIFDDYLEMAEYLLNENWFAAAAVITGSTMEAHLRNLAIKNGMPITYSDAKGKIQSKTADKLNTDLYTAKFIDKINHGVIGGWIKIRNEAAHGNYSTFSAPQVRNMLDGVRIFIGANPL